VIFLWPTVRAYKLLFLFFKDSPNCVRAADFFIDRKWESFFSIFLPVVRLFALCPFYPLHPERHRWTSRLQLCVKIASIFFRRGAVVNVKTTQASIAASPQTKQKVNTPGPSTPLQLLPEDKLFPTLRRTVGRGDNCKQWGAGGCNIDTLGQLLLSAAPQLGVSKQAGKHVWRERERDVRFNTDLVIKIYRPPPRLS